MTAATTPAYLHYTLTLRSPAIVSTLAGAPGSALTQPFIPGSAIRGAVAARLLADGEEPTGDTFRGLVLSGEIRYLHAYPEVGGARALPMPISWRSERNDELRGRDLAAYSGEIQPGYDAKDFRKVWPEISLASAPAPFMAAGGSSRKFFNPRIDARLHQQRDRQRGRPWKDGDENPHGTIFPSEYLEADQVFRGVVQVAAGTPGELSARVRAIEELFSEHRPPILIGRARRAGYGGEAAITDICNVPREYENVRTGHSKDVATGACFRLMLVSAYIGRHPWTGQLDPTVLEDEIRDRLGQDATVERRRWSFETLGGFNRKWRLEVPQALAITAGAVLVLRAGKPISRDMLRQIEHEGLGERRVEGFGRVLFLEHTDDDRAFRFPPLSAKPDDRATTSAPLSDVPDDEAKHIDFLERRIVLTAARTELDRTAADIAGKTRKIPTSSLLGRIRTLFRGVHDESTAKHAMGMLTIWCSDDDNPDALAKQARAKLDDCRIGNDNLRQWLRKIARPEPGKTCWDAIVVASGHASIMTSLAQSHHLTSELAAQKILKDNAAQLAVRLIDTMLAALARKNRRGLP